MNEAYCDVAIIGAGSAGLRAYKAARQHGARALLIEGARYGTTCASVGCMPSKLLIAAADAADVARTAGVFGIHTGNIQVDGTAVMQRVREERDRFTGNVVRMTRQIPSEDRLEGYARFENDTTIVVGDHTRVHTRSTVIATGSRAARLPLFDDLGDLVAVNDDVFSWQDLPDSVAVFGPGIIGLELGQALHRLGVRIRMFGIQNLIGPLTDPEVKKHAERIFGDEFLLDTDARVESLRREGSTVVVRFQEKSGRSDDSGPSEPRLLEEQYSVLLAATGRTPNTERLQLENTSLELDDHGIPLYDPATMQCGDSPIFIAGDATADVPLLHEAAAEGLIAGANAARYPAVQANTRHVPLSIVFTDPQIAMVGQPYHELPQEEIVIGELDWQSDPRARMMNTNQGLLRLYAEKSSGRLIGSEMIGPRAEHIAHQLAWALEQEMTVAQLLDLPYYHPVYEEGLRSALQSLAKQM
ncbi:dihydrolipoyl dehydrogenase [Spirochaeta africana]|uniref:Pyruvate/2-oxoglutarate dehydrogenase complex, dihydrolipoamide dehydrogenase component n=1 Tax=Spirochaeta africana (strain ATCC 700263 / DSM 8902 / Z-7692) TaxID=889378 RepID=H9UH74_SPIAZ|nr:dihydrolipoyl dehydrogenase [Spirochaeta africana]AFG36867.1 pyruvate/2-oxoglutarate dehydrogenase complex, dihydrolipoamide dehydrogenase component [Spirochaeta africana DSM 8902]